MSAIARDGEFMQYTILCEKMKFDQVDGFMNVGAIFYAEWSLDSRIGYDENIEHVFYIVWNMIPHSALSENVALLTIVDNWLKKIAEFDFDFQ